MNGSPVKVMLIFFIMLVISAIGVIVMAHQLGKRDDMPDKDKKRLITIITLSEAAFLLVFYYMLTQADI